jgi:glycosyltransferase involved in cell wall biosynthesis
MNLSIIIPIYKTEIYLEECVNCILSQTSQDIEIILVDDGSPDHCPQICDEFAKSDARVKVIHKQNGGLSSARNAGMTVANGKYVSFIDSDDLIYPDSITEILSWICNSDADICFLKAEKFYPDGTRQDLNESIEREPLRDRSREEAMRYLISRPKYPGSAWGKLYKRKFLIENNLHFPYDRRYSEDLGFLRDCFFCAESFDALEIPFYRYRQNRQGSITSKVTAKNFNDLFLFISESVARIDEKSSTDPVVKSFLRFVAYEYLVLLFLYTRLPSEEKKEALLKLKQFAWTLSYSTGKKEKAAGLFCRVFGVRFTAFIIKQYRRIVEE